MVSPIELAITLSMTSTAVSIAITVRKTIISLARYRVMGRCPSAVNICPMRSSASTLTMREASTAVTIGMRRAISWANSLSCRAALRTWAEPLARSVISMAHHPRHTPAVLAAMSQ